MNSLLNCLFVSLCFVLLSSAFARESRLYTTKPNHRVRQPQSNSYYPPDTNAQAIINILNQPSIEPGDIQTIQNVAKKLEQSSFGTAGDTIGPVSQIQSLIASLDPNNVNYQNIANIQGYFLGAAYIDSGHKDNAGVYLITTVIAAAHDYAKTTAAQQQALLASLQNAYSLLQQSNKFSPEELQKLNEQIQGLPATAISLADFANTLRSQYFN